MIVSASRRTDIPAFYTEWFFKRISEGKVQVRNPRNLNLVKEISLVPDNVDGFVFWTKNPSPMISSLSEIEKYAYYFQFTLNSYENDVEPNVAKKEERVGAFKKLSDLIGPDRIVWRYDPILLTKKYSVEWHVLSFEKTSNSLSGRTKKCVISFVDEYKKCENNLRSIGLIDFDERTIYELSAKLAEISEKSAMELTTCAESSDLSSLGIKRGKCVDAGLLEKISGRKVTGTKDRARREKCLCDTSVDIGVYGSCPAGCIYCYAGPCNEKVRNKFFEYDPNLPLLSF
ncbi:DUF1848 domain-containing protein [candidate division WOR-3 bacterium]|nr:DUF1848 domain-containing protein [candidate division WOR-3 bacterium]